MSTVSRDLAAGCDFDTAASHALTELRGALADVIADLPEQISTATNLQRTLKTSMKVSWKIFKMVQTQDPLALAHLVPGFGAIRLFLRAAAKQKVPPTIIDKAVAATEGFERFVGKHAGDRAAFEGMISKWSVDGRASMDLAYKRAAFRSNSYFYGLQATAQLSCCLVTQSAAEGRLDAAMIRGFLGLRRLRPHVPCVVARMRLTDDRGVNQEVVREPLDPRQGNKNGISLLWDFCSQPLPQFRSVPADDGFLHGELVGNNVGSTAAVDCITGEITRNGGSRYASELSQRFGVCAIVRIPTKVMILDLLVSEGTFDTVAPEVVVFGEHFGGPGFPSPTKERDRLDMLESVVYLGKGLSVLRTRDVPRYVEMARYAVDRLRLDENSFDVYRCRIEYPVMPSSVVVRFDLPERRQPSG